jgi:hypothetical protein
MMAKNGTKLPIPIRAIVFTRGTTYPVSSTTTMDALEAKTVGSLMRRTIKAQEINCEHFISGRVGVLSKGNIDSGKNVCIYYLLGNCKFGDVRCIYSHSKRYLDDGWWNHEEDVEMARVIMMVAAEEEREGGERTIDKIISLLQRGGFAKCGRDIRVIVGNGKGKEGKEKRNRYAGRGRFHGYVDSIPLEHEDEGEGEDEERMMNFGFTQSDVEELMCQGVMPWDDDARVSVFRQPSSLDTHLDKNIPLQGRLACFE